MGNSNGKTEEQRIFTPDELKILESAFRALSGPTKDLDKEKLQEQWSPIIDKYLIKCTIRYLFKAQGASSIRFKQFTQPYNILVHGTIDMKMEFLLGSLENATQNQFTLRDLEKYIAGVVRSYFQILAANKIKVYEDWRQHGYQSTERSIITLTKGWGRTISEQHDQQLESNHLEKWLQLNPTFLQIWREVFELLYSKSAGRTNGFHRHQTDLYIMPELEGFVKNSQYRPILEIPHIIYINSNLPNTLRNKWRLLFSSRTMGESFSTMLGKILDKGPTLFIVEDEDQYIFGGFAPESWALGPTFSGNDTSILFTVCPAMRCFSPTGYNEHYQYLNLNQQTMPNGLGMGGQFDFWGLWLDSTYGEGHSSESCTTYRGYVQLSKRKQFRVHNLEVWGIGDEPVDDDDDENGHKNRSILDKNLEDRVMLELSGHKMQSDGLRDEPFEDYQLKI